MRGSSHLLLLLNRGWPIRRRRRRAKNSEGKRPFLPPPPAAPAPKAGSETKVNWIFWTCTGGRWQRKRRRKKNLNIAPPNVTASRARSRGTEIYRDILSSNSPLFKFVWRSQNFFLPFPPELNLDGGNGEGVCSRSSPAHLSKVDSGGRQQGG